ncbi:hypothetical protein Droror1_Dr00005161 [Drosera rotundifolia]
MITREGEDLHSQQKTEKHFNYKSRKTTSTEGEEFPAGSSGKNKTRIESFSITNREQGISSQGKLNTILPLNTKFISQNLPVTPQSLRHLFNPLTHKPQASRTSLPD